MSPDPLLPNTNQVTLQQIWGYQGKMGSINYAATQTHPDVACAASNLVEFATNPSQQHQDAAN